MNLTRGIRLPDSRTSRIFSAIGVLLVIALVVPFVVYSVPAVVGGEESYVVLTASMTPAISPGDAVVVADVAAEDVVVGDVITYRRSPTDEIPVTHRVIGVVETEQSIAFQTKGDANEDPDAASVTPDRLVGKVILTIPYIGYVVQFVNSPMGFVALVVIPIGLLIVSEVYEFAKGRRGAADSADGRSAEATDSTGTVGAVDASDGDTADDAATVSATPTEEKGVSLSFTTADLTLSSVLLVAFAAYGSFIAWTLRDSLSIAVAVAVVSIALVALAMRFSVGPAPQAGSGVFTDGGETFVAPTATLTADQHDLPRVGVDSVDDLMAMAGRVGRPVVRDGDGTYYLLFGDVAYTAAARTDPDVTLDDFEAANDPVDEEVDDEPVASTDDTAEAR